jgi:hypothetical protein
MVSDKTLYSYIAANLFETSVTDLLRKVKMKPRRAKPGPKVERACRIGRDYRDFLLLTDNGSEFSNPSAIETDGDGIVWTRINAHFLVCFIALLIARIVETRLGNKHTIAKITETLRKVECNRIDQNLRLFDFADEVTDEMNAVFGTDFGRKIMTLEEIKKNLGTAKKG